MRLLTTIEIKLRAFSGMGYEFTDIAGPVISHHRIYYFVCNIVFFFQSCLRVSDKNVLSVKGYLLNVADVEAAKFQDVLINDLFLDPLYKGSYPEMALDSLAKYNPAFKPGAEDMAFIAAQKPDFLGVNFYAPAMVKGEDTPMSLKWLDNNPDSIKSNVGPVMPEYLYKILMRLKTEYNNPKVYITENGTGFKQEDVKMNNKINDPLRADYIKRHIEWALKAKKEGANLNGYMVWSGWDNFKWVAGYTKRLGLIYVDFATQERTPRQSFYEYQKIIREQKL